MEFCIIAHQRSGSSALAEAIQNGTRKKFIYEPFNEESYKWNKELENLSYIEILDFLKNTKDYDFFKTLTIYKNINSIDIINDCYKNFPSIILVREDAFNVAMSLTIAQKTNIWSRYHKADKSNYEEIVKSLEITEDEFCSNYLTSINMIHQLKKFFKDKNSISTQFFTFDQFFNESGPDEETLKRLETITGVINRDMFVWTLKQHKINNKETYKYIKNYKELRSYAN